MTADDFLDLLDEAGYIPAMSAWPPEEITGMSWYCYPFAMLLRMADGLAFIIGQIEITLADEMLNPERVYFFVSGGCLCIGPCKPGPPSWFLPFHLQQFKYFPK